MYSYFDFNRSSSLSLSCRCFLPYCPGLDLRTLVIVGIGRPCCRAPSAIHPGSTPGLHRSALPDSTGRCTVAPPPPGPTRTPRTRSSAAGCAATRWPSGPSERYPRSWAAPRERAHTDSYIQHPTGLSLMDSTFWHHSWQHQLGTAVAGLSLMDRPETRESVEHL